MERANTDPPFSALAHRYRRAVLACVREHNVMTLADLADELAVDEHGATIDGIPAAAVTELYLSLYHHHIPLLEDAGLVAYDQDQDLVMITGEGSAAHTYLEEQVYEFSEPSTQLSRECPDEGSC